MENALSALIAAFIVGRAASARNRYVGTI